MWDGVEQLRDFDTVLRMTHALASIKMVRKFLDRLSKRHAKVSSRGPVSVLNSVDRVTIRCITASFLHPYIYARYYLMYFV